jgi:outer membrane protein OmpA-like peptidoglycan-associated protein
MIRHKLLHRYGHVILPLGAALFGISVTCGCASTPAPPELLEARSAYIRAESGIAAQYKPDRLHEAKVALDRAEKAYSDSPGKQSTRDLAYVAERQAELAEVQARDAKAAQDKAQAEKDLESATQSQLSQTRAQLSSTGQQLSGAQQALAGTQQQLQHEKSARAEAEKRAREAFDKLAATAAGSIKQETRGTVITIPGSVLFASGKTTLLPGAQDKLNLVADALKNQDNRQIVVEGHTDTQGGDDSNLVLSQGRAQAVREYLVSRGVPADRIRSQGFGSTRPLADNKSPEGRANNRRVEIIVQPLETK